MPFMSRKLLIAACALMPALAQAHPHVFVESNLEELRSDDGLAREIRHVWRFDEMFSSTVLLDFDDNGNGQLDPAELDTIAAEVKKNISKFNFYTEVRAGRDVANFYEPDPFLVDYKDGQIIMILAMELENPQQMKGSGFKVAVSDPTYYVAMELWDNSHVQLAGNTTGCKWDIVRPDFDKLLRENPEIANDDYGGTWESGLPADAFLTWVHFECE